MRQVGVRALKQNASAVVADVAKGETVTITDRGRAVAQLVPIPTGNIEALIAAGRARAARTDLRDLGPAPRRRSGEVSLSAVVQAMRDDERD